MTIPEIKPIKTIEYESNNRNMNNAESYLFEVLFWDLLGVGKRFYLSI